MEWLKAILEKAVITDGKLDVEATMKSINAEFPKHAVPKQDYNDKVKELTTAKAFVESRRDADGLLSGEDAKTYAEMEQKVKNYETEIAGYKTAAENTKKEYVLKDKLKEMSEDEQLKLLATDGMLVKRPLVIGDDFVLTGFKEKEWEEKING